MAVSNFRSTGSFSATKARTPTFWRPTALSIAEAVQVHEVGKFEAVTERSAGCENRIPQAQRANFYAEVNGASGTHFVEENNTKRLLPVAKSLASSSTVGRSSLET